MVKSKTQILLCALLAVYGYGELSAQDPVPSTPPPEQADDPELAAIRRTVEAYQSAMEARDTARAANLVTGRTFQYYRQIMYWAMYGNEEELRGLKYMEQLLTLRLRQRVKPEEMKAAEDDGRASYRLAVERGSDDDIGPAGAKVARLERRENAGRALLKIGDRVGFLLFVLREPDGWRVDLPATIQVFNDRMSRVPKDLHLRGMLGLSKPEELTALYRPPFPEGPEVSPGFYVFRGTMRLQQNRFKEALVDFNRAIKCDPTKPAWFEIRGDLQQILGRPDDALRDYDRALALAPGRPAAHMGRAEVLTIKGDYESAVIESNRALLNDPFYNQALLSRGTALQRLKRYDAAHADFTRYILRRPMDVDGHLHRADLFRERGDWPRALADAESAFEIDPRNTTVLKILADYYLKSDTRVVKVPAMTGLCLRDRPGDLECVNFRAEAFYRLQYLDEAEALTRDLLRRDNLGPEIRRESELRRKRIRAARDSGVESRPSPAPNATPTPATPVR